MGKVSRRVLRISPSEVPLDFQGFGFEGAAMALTMLDALTPWRRRHLARFQRIQQAFLPEAAAA